MLTCAALPAHRIQSLFNSLGDEVKGATIGLGGDGRYFNKQAAQIIMKMAAAAGVQKACLLSSLSAAHTQHGVCRNGLAASVMGGLRAAGRCGPERHHGHASHVSTNPQAEVVWCVPGTLV